jgi:hypothetical protein
MVAAAGKGALLGSCQLWVAAARDGSTLFWSHDRCVVLTVVHRWWVGMEGTWLLWVAMSMG